MMPLKTPKCRLACKISPIFRRHTPHTHTLDRVYPPQIPLPQHSGTRPPSRFFYIYGWLIKIYGCFLAKTKNCGEGIFRLKTSAVYQNYG